MKKVIVSIFFKNRYYWTLAQAKILPNGKTVISENVITNLLQQAKAKRGQTYSRQ